MDLAIETPPVTAMDLATPATGEASAVIAARVAHARQAQEERARSLFLNRNEHQKKTAMASLPLTNARLSDPLLEKVAKPDADGTALLVRAAESLSLTARAYTRTLRVARTLADLEGLDAVKRRHIAEAISYRRREESPVSLTAQTAAPQAQAGKVNPY